MSFDCGRAIVNGQRIQQLDGKINSVSSGLSGSIKNATDQTAKLSEAVEKKHEVAQKLITESNRIIGEHIQSCTTESAVNDQRLQHVEDNGAQRERRITQLESENAELRQIIEAFRTRLTKLEAKQKHGKAAFEAHLKHCDRSQRPREEHANLLTSPLTSDDEGEYQ